MKLGMIVRCDDSGLGNQSRNLAYMLRPEKIMLIDSSSFNGNEQHPEWYDGFSGIVVRGFPSVRECRAFLRGLTHVLTCETPYNYMLYTIAEAMGIEVFTQHNYEFLDHLRDPHITRPRRFLSPSYWKLEEMRAQFPDTIYLPPPLSPDDFAPAREANLRRSGGRRRFLHIVGRRATCDRNGTLSLLSALDHTDADFELVIRSQAELDLERLDPRVRVIVGNSSSEADLYADFDAMIMPRRYGGLCLPMNEALMSALPVIMTDCSPNNRVLPADWLVLCRQNGTLMARTELELHEAVPTIVAARIEWLCSLKDEQLRALKDRAYSLALNEYSVEALRHKYEEVMDE